MELHLRGRFMNQESRNFHPEIETKEQSEYKVKYGSRNKQE